MGDVISTSLTMRAIYIQRIIASRGCPKQIIYNSSSYLRRSAEALKNNNQTAR